MAFFRSARKYLRQYGQLSGIHGLQYLAERRSKTEKIVWVLILVASLCGCLFMINEIWEKFKCSPVVISFGTEEVPIFELPFPGVTICPESQVRASKSDFSELTQKLFQGENLTDSEIKLLNYLEVFCTTPVHRGSETIDENFYDMIEQQMEYDLNSSLLECNFMGQSLPCAKIFTPILTKMGICYSFNILDRSHIFKEITYTPSGFFQAQNKLNDFDPELGYTTENVVTYPTRALMSGVGNGLLLIFKTREFDMTYYCGFMQGYRVTLHNSWDVPIITKRYLHLPADKVQTAIIQPELVTTSERVMRFSPETRKCYSSNERSLKYFSRYTKSNCYTECLTNYTLLHCGCVAFYMPRDNSTSICGQGNRCFKEAERNFKIEEHQVKSKTWGDNYCKCRPLCVDIKYKVETSATDFHWKKFFIAQGIRNAEEDNYTSSYSIFNLYFKHEYFVTLERHELYGVFDLISNFGGLLSLFTGFSLITLAEIIYFLTLRIYYNIQLYGIWIGTNH